MRHYEELFTSACLERLFPSKERTDAFFEALFGDAEDGAYDIKLSVHRFLQKDGERLEFFFELHQRNGMCLACNLTHGLPQVFRRHPVIALQKLCADIAVVAGWQDAKWHCELSDTEEVSDALHVIPLAVIKG